MSNKQIYINGDVVTMNEAAPKAEAIGVSGESIAIVGTNEEVKAWGGSDAEVIDVGGKPVLPGLIESHNHISPGAVWSSYANCSSVACSSVEEVLDAISDRAKKTPVGEWVQGFGLDDTANADMRHLNKHDLDAITTEHPIYISHVSGHLGYLNSMALDLAGINRDTPDPSGGTIVKQDDGEPDGLLLENAAFGVRAIIPEPSREKFKELFIQQIADFNATGITSTHDAAIGMLGDGHDFFLTCRELEQEGRMNIRIYTAVIEDAYNKYDELGVAKGYGSHYVKVGGVKYFQDGSIQGFTGALIEEYHTKPGHFGDLIYPQEVLNEKFIYHQGNGDHIVVHGNGDRAIESILQAFEAAQEAHPRENTRHMLIHAQMAHDDHILRMKKLGIIPSYFINHVYYWGDRHKNIFMGPERAARVDPLARSLELGVPPAVHSDFPITPFDPWFTLHTCVNRLTRSGEVLGPDQRISAYEALRAFTITAAMCSFEEDIKGTIEPGKLADFIVCDRNMLEIDPLEIKDIKVLRTVIGGRTVHTA